MSDAPDNPEIEPGLMATVKRLARTAVATVHNRIELFALEFQEEGARFIGILLLAACVLMFGGLALIMGMFTILLAVGEEHRLLAAILMTIALLGCSAAAALCLKLKLKTWSAFQGTRAELRKDREWLQSSTSEN